MSAYAQYTLYAMMRIIYVAAPHIIKVPWLPSFESSPNQNVTESTFHTPIHTYVITLCEVIALVTSPTHKNLGRELKQSDPLSFQTLNK